jgi:nucleoside-diphosphate-sugar epimerase
MRVLILGGTSFIGRAVARQLLEDGHHVAVFHRGRTEPPELAAATHLHGERLRLADHRHAILRFAPDAVVDSYALTRRDAEVACEVLPEGLPAVVLSSQDVYAAFAGFLTGRAVSAVPLPESAALRTDRRLYQEQQPPGVPADYEKLDVEEVWGARGATLLRLPMVYGPHDPQCREGFVLRRLAAGRRVVPVGAGNLLWSRAAVGDVADAVVRALRSEAVRGRCLNLAEPVTVTVEQWMHQIAEAAGLPMKTVRVPEELLPADLRLTGTFAQHVVADVRAAQDLLGWRPTAPERRVADSVRWHLAHGTVPPWSEADGERDDAALAARLPVRP